MKTGTNGVVVVAFIAAVSIPGCGTSDSDKGTGSVECCKVRQICAYCLCSDAQESAGLQDQKTACVNALAAWQGIGCIACQNNGCLSACH